MTRQRPRSHLALAAALLVAASTIRTIRGDCEDWQATLDQHNMYRARHSAPPLYWDNGLADGANSWAQGIVNSGCSLQHSGGGYGENLAAFYYNKASGACVDSTNMWYDEVSNYRFTNTPYSDSDFGSTGHFTQVVWKSTTGLGCGSASSGSCTAVVCRYSPPGNYQGDGPYLANVSPAGGDPAPTPGTPGAPRAPGQPGQPRQPGNPSRPGAPGRPGAPDVPPEEDPSPPPRRSPPRPARSPSPSPPRRRSPRPPSPSPPRRARSPRPPSPRPPRPARSPRPPSPSPPRSLRSPPPSRHLRPPRPLPPRPPRTPRSPRPPRPARRSPPGAGAPNTQNRRPAPLPPRPPPRPLRAPRHRA